MKKLLLPVLFVSTLVYAEPTENVAEAQTVQAILEGNVDRLKSLLAEKSVNVHFVDSHKNSFLHYAVLVGNTEIITILIDRGVDISVKDKFGKTALETAKSLGNPRVISTLESVQHFSLPRNPPQAAAEGNVVSIDFRVKSQVRKMAKAEQSKQEIKEHLWEAVQDLNVRRLTQVLSDKGAKFINDVFVKNSEKHRLLDSIIERCWIAHLASRDSPILNQEILQKYKKVIEVLIDFGADLNAIHRDAIYGKHTPLTRAVGHSLVDVVVLLLEKGANPNLLSSHNRAASVDYHAPLGIALRKSDLRIALILLNHGADINLQGGSILRGLIQSGSSIENMPVILFALKHGADPSLALKDAVIAKNTQMVQILLQYGANPHSPYDSNLSILQYAKKKLKGSKIISLLKNSSCQRIFQSSSKAS